MRLLQRRLNRHGFRAHNIGYSSRRLTIEQAADEVMEKIAPLIAGRRRCHFVTHSLGGIVLRTLLVSRRIQRPGRVVMLAPPSQGSELADRLQVSPVLRFLLGPAFMQLGTAEDSLPNRLINHHSEIGVIAGSRSINPLFASYFRDANDGKVSVSRAQLHGMKDFIVVPRSHTFIMNSDLVARQTINFLEHGRFRR